MIEPASLTNPGAERGISRPHDETARVRNAAGQFEALLIAQMLKSMRQSNGWLGAGEDQASSSAMEYAQEMFAQSLSASGGLGLARIVAEGLSREDGT